MFICSLMKPNDDPQLRAAGTMTYDSFADMQIMLFWALTVIFTVPLRSGRVYQVTFFYRELYKYSK